MTHDTAKDPRILSAGRACALLRQALQQKTHAKLAVGKETLKQKAAAAESAVMTLMYSYQAPPELVASEPMHDLLAAASDLGEALGPALSGAATPPLLRATLAWCLRTLGGLPARLANSGKTLASGVDLVAVEVRSAVKTGSLWLTRVSDGRSDHTVVTNLEGIRPGDVLAAAFLPPREVGGTVSEAMFLGARRRPEPPGAVLDEERVDAREAASILHEELGKR